MESLFVDRYFPTQFRTANSIKNRFYTVIRTFLKILFRLHPSIIDKLPHEIPSKTVLKFYEARNGIYTVMQSSQNSVVSRKKRWERSIIILSLYCWQRSYKKIYQKYWKSTTSYSILRKMKWMNMQVKPAGKWLQISNLLTLFSATINKNKCINFIMEWILKIFSSLTQWIFLGKWANHAFLRISFWVT